MSHIRVTVKKRFLTDFNNLTICGKYLWNRSFSITHLYKIDYIFAKLSRLPSNLACIVMIK